MILLNHLVMFRRKHYLNNLSTWGNSRDRFGHNQQAEEPHGLLIL